MKRVLGLDIGTNSIGWALIENDDQQKKGSIIAAGCRILPMSQDILGKFDSGQSISQTAERTRYRSMRRLRERYLLRRERLHRVLHILGFLPTHYADQVDFTKRPGQFLPGVEPKLPYRGGYEKTKWEFLFMRSFNEMLSDFTIHQPQLVENGKKVPYDWTIYYLRKKALTNKIEKEELAWLLLQFNQKRGYYQLRSEDDDDEMKNKYSELHSLQVVDVVPTEDRKNNDEIWYNIVLENGWVYKRTGKTPPDWKGKIKEFIVTVELNEDGTIKKDKSGKEKRSFRAPADDDWTLVKKRTEYDLDKSQKNAGVYIYDNILKNPNQKVRGKLVRVIERKYYVSELEQILKKQKEFHPELSDKNFYQECLRELYPNNENHRNSIEKKDFTYLFLHDIIFYQRPLKSKKSLISNCQYEVRVFVRDGERQIEPLKCISKSHPLFQEFRLWQFIHNLRIIQKEKVIEGKLKLDEDVTSEFFKSEDDWVDLFDWLNTKREIDQKSFFRYPGLGLKKNINQFKWNYLEDKSYPCNETRTQISLFLDRIGALPENFLTKATEEALWHILYSVEDKQNLQKALKTFAAKNNLSDDFVKVFVKFPSYKKEYGSYSAKAIKKLLPLMRAGRHWNEYNIDHRTKDRIDKIITGEYDETIKERVREKTLEFKGINDFKRLPHWLSSYIVYDRHSEDSEMEKWKTADQIMLLPQHSLRNPIVEQVINETLQVVKDIWNKYGKGEEGFFHSIHIELGREMKNPADRRRKMTEQINENENTNLRIKALLMELLNDGDIENVRPHSPMQQEILKIYEEGALSLQQEIPADIFNISRQAQPSKSDLDRYKLWLQQKYRSPYTGRVIPLNKLFTRQYDIDHIIPQSRYFDDSFSNKIICETTINQDKDKNTAYEYIAKSQGKAVEIGFGESRNIFTLKEYEEFIKTNFSRNRIKMKKLLMEDIPESFIQRQLNDSRYISKVVKGLMSNIVRDKDEQEAISKNVIVSNGSITSTLRQEWGLNDVWNEIITPRFVELNTKTNSEDFGNINPATKKFLPKVSLSLQKGFNKKRVDHRHHPLDAIIIACSSRSHVNYLNNESALEKGTKEEKEKKRYDLRRNLCFKKYTDNAAENYRWTFHKPWESFTQEVKGILLSTIVSFKQNLRVINKAANHYLKWNKDENGKIRKELVVQDKGSNWSIRKPMHKETVSGVVQFKLKKVVSLSAALDNQELIVKKSLKNKIKELASKQIGKKGILEFFKLQGNKWDGVDVSRVEIYFWDNENVASRVKIDDNFNSSMIERVTDSGIRKIMMEHLKKFHEMKDGKIIEHPELAFSPDGLDDLNKNIAELNGGRFRQPIYKVRTYEPKGNKFEVGQIGNKRNKWAEAAKGTNLFFAVYIDSKGGRGYETVPLNIVIERQKQGLSPVPETNEPGNSLLFYLSPNDLIYVPMAEEQGNGNHINFGQLTVEQVGRIYKVVSFTGKRLYAIPHTIATSIVDKFEFTQLNKLEFSPEKMSIKEVCIPLTIDRLGNIKFKIKHNLQS